MMEEVKDFSYDADSVKWIFKRQNIRVEFSNVNYANIDSQQSYIRVTCGENFSENRILYLAYNGTTVLKCDKISGKISWKYDGDIVAIYCEQIDNAKIFNKEKLVMVINKAKQKNTKLLLFHLNGTPLFEIAPPNGYQLLYFSSVNNKPSVVCESSTLHDKYGRNTWQFIIDTKAGKLLKSNLAY